MAITAPQRSKPVTVITNKFKQTLTRGKTWNKLLIWYTSTCVSCNASMVLITCIKCKCWSIQNNSHIDHLCENTYIDRCNSCNAFLQAHKIVLGHNNLFLWISPCLVTDSSENHYTLDPQRWVKYCPYQWGGQNKFVGESLSFYTNRVSLCLTKLE